jgi:predicted protein tyrosine phosphatase
VLDLSFVAPGLAVGAAYPMHAAARLAAEHGIARVVDLRVEACDDERVLRTHGIRLLHLPTCDARAVSQQMLREGVEFVSEGLDGGERVLVHCQYGIGRSPLLALCTLVVRGDSPLAALERAKRARPLISPTPEQLEALRTFAARVQAERGAPWGVPSLPVLGRVAWSHLLGGADAWGEDSSSASTRSD